MLHLRALAAVQVNQLKADAARLEESSSALTREIQEAQTSISQNPIKQEVLRVQGVIRSLEGEKAGILENRTRLEDPKGSVELLQNKLQRDLQALETLRSDVKALQASVKDKEALVGGYRGASKQPACVLTRSLLSRFRSVVSA
jgi:peptidoglycan hydrolase CwlO-like protein